MLTEVSPLLPATLPVFPLLLTQFFPHSLPLFALPRFAPGRYTKGGVISLHPPYLFPEEFGFTLNVFLFSFFPNRKLSSLIVTRFNWLPVSILRWTLCQSTGSSFTGKLLIFPFFVRPLVALLKCGKKLYVYLHSCCKCLLTCIQTFASDTQCVGKHIEGVNTVHTRQI